MKRLPCVKGAGAVRRLRDCKSVFLPLLQSLAFLFVNDGHARGLDAGLLVNDGVDLRDLSGLKAFGFNDDARLVSVENGNAFFKALGDNKRTFKVFFK